jgi:hypothetical protein
VKLIPLLGTKLSLDVDPITDEVELNRSMLLLDQDTGDIFGVPAGFRCDGESIPGFLPETAAGDAGGIPHDLCYRFGFIFLWQPAGGGYWAKQRVTREWADRLYRATCIAYSGWGWWARTKWAFLRYSGKPLLVWIGHRRANRVWAGGEPETPPWAATVS